MMIHLSIMPVADDVHLSEPVAAAVKIVHDSGLEYRLTAMGTLIRGDWNEVMGVVKACHETILQKYDRVVTQVKIDDNKNGDPGFDDKVKSAEEKSGITLNK